MIKVQRLKRLLKRINSVWQEYDTLNNWIGVVWLVRKQLEEIEEKKYEASAVLNEMADILIIIVRYLDHIGIDPEKLMVQRLETRHRGKVKEIVVKYARKFKEEQENALHSS